jgi:hypothetical protein
MKFYKRKPIDTVNPMSNSWVVLPDGRIYTNSTSTVQMPVGKADGRPVATVNNGQIRYNSEIGQGGELEAYINGTWEIIKTNRHATVTKQEFQNGDYADTIFGPLAYDIDPAKPENLQVYVENVWQIPGTNYELKLSQLGAPLTTTTNVSRAVYFGETVIPLDDIADFNVGVSLNGTNLQNNVIVDTSATDSTITISPGALGFIPQGSVAIAVYSTGTFIKFTPSATPVPFKPVIALLGLDGYCPPFEV